MRTREVKVGAPGLRVVPERAVQPFRWTDIFDVEGPVEVEIGIGKGRFLLAVAALRPDVLHFGVEWANKYLRIAESRAAKRGLENVRFARVDARELVCAAIPNESVSAYYVFYPDPWPKKRHQKRRFIQAATADHLARTLIAGGLLHVATDHADYWESIEPLLDGHPAFERLVEFGAEGFPLPTEGPLTNYEEKYRIEGRNRFRGSWRRLAGFSVESVVRISVGRPGKAT
jgi:tRNA (guanine-N7-)-methyltransferase